MDVKATRKNSFKNSSSCLPAQYEAKVIVTKKIKLIKSSLWWITDLRQVSLRVVFHTVPTWAAWKVPNQSCVLWKYRTWVICSIYNGIKAADIPLRTDAIHLFIFIPNTAYYSREIALASFHFPSLSYSTRWFFRPASLLFCTMNNICNNWCAWKQLSVNLYLLTWIELACLITMIFCIILTSVLFFFSTTHYLNVIIDLFAI